jgi:hypothetical protein
MGSAEPTPTPLLEKGKFCYMSERNCARPERRSPIAVLNSRRRRHFCAESLRGVVFLAGMHEGQAALLATVSQDLTSKLQAGKLIQAVAPMLGGLTADRACSHGMVKRCAVSGG